MWQAGRSTPCYMSLEFRNRQSPAAQHTDQDSLSQKLDQDKLGIKCNIAPRTTYSATTACSLPPARHRMSAMARARQRVLWASEGCSRLMGKGDMFRFMTTQSNTGAPYGTCLGSSSTQSHQLGAYENISYQEPGP